MCVRPRWICVETRHVCYVWCHWHWFRRQTHCLRPMRRMLSSSLYQRPCYQSDLTKRYVHILDSQIFTWNRFYFIYVTGWRCLDCTVCEGCGLKHDEANIVLCDECDISYHIYCMSPPLETVPTGTWKCKWCAVCHTCGSNDPGRNSRWHENFSLCGPCHSLQTCNFCDGKYYFFQNYLVNSFYQNQITKPIVPKEKSDFFRAIYRLPLFYFKLL